MSQELKGRIDSVADGWREPGWGFETKPFYVRPYLPEGRFGLNKYRCPNLSPAK